MLFFLANKENKLSKTSFQMQLKLALAWKRIDVAKSEIFTEDLKQKASTQQADTDRDNNYEVYRCNCVFIPIYTIFLINLFTGLSC